MKEKMLILFFVFNAVFFPSLLCADDVAVIVNKENSEEDITFRELVDIFKQKKQYWNRGEKVFLVLQEMIMPETKIVLRKVYGMTGPELKKYWLQRIFKEDLAGVPFSLSSNEATKAFVGRTPNAIGFVDETVVDQTVKTLKIDGRSPGDSDYVLKD